MTSTWEHPDEPARPWIGTVVTELHPVVTLDDGSTEALGFWPHLETRVTDEVHAGPARLGTFAYAHLADVPGIEWRRRP